MANRDIWDEIELVGKGEHLDEEMFEYLSAYADGECTAKERRLVEAYLAESAEARAQLADLRMQAAIASEGFVDPPIWLRGAILAKTVDRSRLKWPFAAALTTATAGAAALAAYWMMPTQPAEPEQELLANVVSERPAIEEPTTIVGAEAAVSVASPKTESGDKSNTIVVKQDRKVGANSMTLTARNLTPKETEPAGSTEVVQPPKPVSEEPDPAVTYAVVEYGGGRFENKQPDVFDSEPVAAEPSRTGPAASSSAVLPDAREKLRDKVRKMNQEKLEIEVNE